MFYKTISFKTLFFLTAENEMIYCEIRHQCKIHDENFYITLLNIVHSYNKNVSWLYLVVIYLFSYPNPQNRAISAKCVICFCHPGNRVHARSHACFLKTRLACSLAIFNIRFWEKCNSSSVHLWERKRERERLCMYELPQFYRVSLLTVKLWL